MTAKPIVQLTSSGRVVTAGARRIAEARDFYATHHFVKLRGLLSRELVEIVRQEVEVGEYRLQDFADAGAGFYLTNGRAASRRSRFPSLSAARRSTFWSHR